MPTQTLIAESSPVHGHDKARGAVATLAAVVLSNPLLYGMVASGGAGQRGKGRHVVGKRLCATSLHCSAWSWLEVVHYMCSSTRSFITCVTVRGRSLHV